MKLCRSLIPLFVLVPMLLSACSHSFHARSPVGQTLPYMVGETLVGERVTLPDDLQGRPAVLLVLYQSSAQDEINYWALVAAANLPEAHLYEVAAFTQFKHRLFRRRLTARATDRVPSSLHARLIGLWSHGKTMARFTGNPRDGNARVLLLDGHGRVIFFTDQGFSSLTMRAFLNAIGEHLRPVAGG